MTQPPTDFQRSTRMPLEAVVRLHFEGTVAYQNGFAANVSATGMFVKHPDPPPVGTRLVFEFTIGAARKPVQGTGEVVWQREKYDGPGRAAGAGIRFVDLDTLSRQALTEALFEFLEASLGERAGEHPEVRALVESRPTHAPVETLDQVAADAAALRSESATRAIPAFAVTEEPPAAAPAADGGAAPTPFRIFDDEDEPLPVAAPPPSQAVPAAFEPVPVEAHAPPPTRGAAVAREPAAGGAGAKIAVGLVAAVLLAAAGWWFFLRPQPAAPTAGAASVVEPEPAPAAPPPLDPAPGRERTLAESVGTGIAAPEPAAAAATTPAPAAVELPAAPAADRESRPLPAGEVRRVATITGEPSASGTRIRISGDGAFRTGRFSWSEIGGDKPRLLIKLKGITEPYRGPSPAASAEIAGVRTGHHQRPDGPELHVVLDFPPGAAVAVSGVTAEGDSLVVDIDRR